jgi:hypothetical protein
MCRSAQLCAIVWVYGSPPAGMAGRPGCCIFAQKKNLLENQGAWADAAGLPTQLSTFIVQKYRRAPALFLRRIKISLKINGLGGAV